MGCDYQRCTYLCQKCVWFRSVRLLSWRTEAVQMEWNGIQSAKYLFWILVLLMDSWMQTYSLHRHKDAHSARTCLDGNIVHWWEGLEGNRHFSSRMAYAWVWWSHAFSYTVYHWLVKLSWRIKAIHSFIHAQYVLYEGQDPGGFQIYLRNTGHNPADGPSCMSGPHIHVHVYMFALYFTKKKAVVKKSNIVSSSLWTGLDYLYIFNLCICLLIGGGKSAWSV